MIIYVPFSAEYRAKKTGKILCNEVKDRELSACTKMGIEPRPETDLSILFPYDLFLGGISRFTY